MGTKLMKRRGFKRLEIEHRARHIEISIKILQQRILLLQVKSDGNSRDMCIEWERKVRDLEDELAEMFLLEELEDEIER